MALSNYPIYSQLTGLPLFRRSDGKPFWGDPDHCSCCAGGAALGPCQICTGEQPQAIVTVSGLCEWDEFCHSAAGVYDWDCFVPLPPPPNDDYCDWWWLKVNPPPDPPQHELLISYWPKRRQWYSEISEQVFNVLFGWDDPWLPPGVVACNRETRHLEGAFDSPGSGQQFCIGCTAHITVG